MTQYVLGPLTWGGLGAGDDGASQVGGLGSWCPRASWTPGHGGASLSCQGPVRCGDPSRIVHIRGGDEDPVLPLTTPVAVWPV